MNLRFDNKVVVVTGGSSGIGEATTKAFINSGGSVIFTGIEDPAQIDMAEYPGAEYYQLDVTDEEAIARFAGYVEKKYGGADVLYNNAGIIFASYVHECTAEEWDKTMDVNARGVFLCTKYFLPQMMEKGAGSIVNTASMSGIWADSTFCSYNSSKGAVVNFTNNLALDYAKYNIRANSVCPGAIRTPMHYGGADDLGGKEVLDAGMCEVYPIGRAGLPEEVAACVLFLASERASFITGHNLVVDGGLTAHTGSQNKWDRVRRECGC